MNTRGLFTIFFSFFLGVLAFGEEITLKTLQENLDSIDKILTQKDISTMTKVISKQVNLKQDMVVEVLIQKNHKISTLVVAQYLGDKLKKQFNEFLPASRDDSLLETIARSGVSIADLARHLDEVTTELSFAVLDRREKGKK